MLDIRPLRWPPKGIRKISPFFWARHIRDIRQRGQIAEWLHNMADFSCRDFADFDEQRFWSEYELRTICYPFPASQGYKKAKSVGRRQGN
jgi:hypothetical protein